MTSTAPLPTTAPITTPLAAVVVLSMLHEGATVNSATRHFRDRPVLAWTLERLQQVSSPGGTHTVTAAVTPAGIPAAIAVWEDQRPAVEAITKGTRTLVLSAGDRAPNLAIDTVAAAQRWADGWRGGPMATCHFDRGFSAAIVAAALKATDTNAALLVDPSAGLIDPELLSRTLEHVEANADRSLVFSPAAPGLASVLLRADLIAELVRIGTHPGRALHYVPDNYASDPIASPAAAPTPPTLARSTRRFTLDSTEQVRLISRATAPLNGQLFTTPATAIVDLVAADTDLPRLPRDVRIDLTSRRVARPLFAPIPPRRTELSPEQWVAVLDQLTDATPSRELTSSTRVAFAGAGDPLMYPGLLHLIRSAAERGIATAVETDLLSVAPETLDALARSPLDILMVHLPAATEAVYSSVMGVDGLAEALQNVARFVTSRRPKGTPIVVPIFTKLRQNQHEMEAWYDHYLRTLGSAVIEGPQHPACAQHAVADMSPPDRKPCRRLSTRLQLLPDGTVAQCDLDVVGGEVFAGTRSVLTTPLSELWHAGLAPLRETHAAGNYSLNVLCSQCKDWHRP